jgi:hypothetical protein
MEFSDVSVAHAIQLAVAPVFLLSGIGAILVVLTNRLGRSIDRACFGRKAGDCFSGSSRRPAGRFESAFAPGKTHQPRHHALHGNGVTCVHGYRISVSERLFKFRCIASRCAAIRRGDAGFLSRLALVSTRDLLGHGKSAYRPSLKTTIRRAIDESEYTTA